MTPNQRQKLPPVALLTMLWVLAALVINPIGDFPLNDDFSFARSVFNLSERGVLEFDKWLDMTIITQVLWGAGWSKVFGFSFTSLRLSVLLLGWLAVIGIYLIANDLNTSKNISLLSALSIGFSPLFFSLSYTFMSDVPFFTCCVWSLFFYNRAFANGQTKWVFWGSLLAVAATFIRQLGFMLPVAFAATWLLREKINWKTLLTAALPLVITTALYLWYTKWFQATQGLPDSYGTLPRLFKKLGDGSVFRDFAWRTGLLAAYLGLALLPLNLALRQQQFWQKKWWIESRFTNAHRIAFFTVLALLLASLVPAWGKIIWANIFYNFGLGPQTLKDGQFFMNTPVQLPDVGKNIVRAVFILSGILLTVKLLPQFFTKLRRSHPHFLTAVFAFANIILYGGFLMLDLKFFDRYFFQLLPFLLVLLVPAAAANARKVWNPASVGALVLIAAFSIAATHDYLAWNRARWQALDHLTEKMKVTPDRIDGGFEFNGWHRVVPERTYGEGRSWWWVKSDEFAVTFGGMEGYEKVQGFPWVRWLRPGRDSVFILEKK